MIRTSNAVWEGNLQQGNGVMKLGSGAYEGAYNFPSRFEEGKGTNPEELLAAAHAGCYSMALSAGLSRAGHVPTRVTTKANVHINRVEGGFGVTLIELFCEAEVPEIDEESFMSIADATKGGCPISKALAAVEIRLEAKLIN